MSGERTVDDPDRGDAPPVSTSAPSSGGATDALRGAVGFLTRLPVGTDRTAWAAFARTPAAFLPVGYLGGALVALSLAPSAWSVPAPATALLLPVAVVAVTGINHADGLSDLGDAAVVHGDADDRRAVMKDSDLGVGGTLALALLVAGLALAGLALAGLPLWAAVALVIASEVGAKLGMAALACLGDPLADGLGAGLVRPADAGDLFVPALLALPAAALVRPAGAVAVIAALLAALSIGRWAGANLGGVSGDVFGAANELGRVAALHAGVVAWTLS